MKKIIPICWKCDHGLWSKNQSEPSLAIKRLNPQVFKGCSEDDRINWENREKFCPLLKKIKKKRLTSAAKSVK